MSTRWLRRVWCVAVGSGALLFTGSPLSNSGQALSQVADARHAGHQQACRDSAPFMQAAQRLYEAAGFRDGAPYPGTEAPAALHAQWRFMARSL